MNLSLTDLIAIKEETFKGNGEKVSEIIDSLITAEREKVTMEIVGKDPLRVAAIQMQLAVGCVLKNGGMEISTWWDTLISAQSNLATITSATSAEFDEIAKMNGISRD